jgi:hypothetical protein
MNSDYDQVKTGSNSFSSMVVLIGLETPNFNSACTPTHLDEMKTQA